MHIRDPNISENNGVNFTKIRSEADLRMFNHARSAKQRPHKRGPTAREYETVASQDQVIAAKLNLW